MTVAATIAATRARLVRAELYRRWARGVPALGAQTLNVPGGAADVERRARLAVVWAARKGAR